MDLKTHLLFFIVLSSVVGCSSHTTQMVGGEATSNGDNSISIGGPAGQSTQIVNISDSKQATAAQVEAISKVMLQIKGILDCNLDPFSAASERLQKAEQIDLKGTPRDFKKAVLEWVSALEELKRYYYITGEKSDSIVYRTELARIKTAYASALKEILNVASVYRDN